MTTNLATLRTASIPVRVTYLGMGSTGVRPLVDQGDLPDRDWPFFGSGDDAMTFPVPNDAVEAGLSEGAEAVMRLQDNGTHATWFLEAK